MTNFSPREIVSELDRYIVGQRAAVAEILRPRPVNAACKP